MARSAVRQTYVAQRSITHMSASCWSVYNRVGAGHVVATQRCSCDGPIDWPLMAGSVSDSARLPPIQLHATATSLPPIELTSTRQQRRTHISTPTLPRSLSHTPSASHLFFSLLNLVA